MLRFDSLEQLGEWARRYGAQELALGQDGSVRGVSFAHGTRADVQDGSDPDPDAPETIRPRSDVDVAAENLLRGYRPKGGAGA